MRIAATGIRIDHPDVTEVTFRSRRSWFDFDAVIWDPTTLLNEYHALYGEPYFCGWKNLDEKDSFEFVFDVNRRLREFQGLVKINRPVILLLSPPIRCYYRTGEAKYSGTGRNRIKTNMVAPFKLEESLGIIPEYIEAEGDLIEIRGRSPYKNYWRKMGEYHHYPSYLSKPKGEPFLFISGTSQVVGTYLSSTLGEFVLILPSLSQKWQFHSKKALKEASATFIEAIESLITDLRKEAGDYSLPSWTSSFLLPGENDKISEIKDNRDQIGRLEKDLLLKKEDLDKLQRHKILLSGSGKALESIVARVLEEIGFTLLETEPNRDDLILQYGERLAVAEIKGKEKSAAERDAAQLEKWVSGYLEKTGNTPKGFLIVNAYCDTPVNLRNRQPFPDQMLSYSLARKHCLFTTTQLLGLLLTVRERSDDNNELIDELFGTVGVYPHFKDYKQFLQLESQLANGDNGVLDEVFADVDPGSTTSSTDEGSVEELIEGADLRDGMEPSSE